MARSRQRARPGELRNKMQGSRKQTRSGCLRTSLGGLSVFYLEGFALMVVVVTSVISNSNDDEDKLMLLLMKTMMQIERGVLL